jgi:hypothetical protein
MGRVIAAPTACQHLAEVRMPIEYKLFMNVPLSDIKCPRCGVSSDGFMRGQVQRSKRFLGFLWRRPYCAIICHICKDIIGYESPP